MHLLKKQLGPSKARDRVPETSASSKADTHRSGRVSEPCGGCSLSRHPWASESQGKKGRALQRVSSVLAVLTQHVSVSVRVCPRVPQAATG